MPVPGQGLSEQDRQFILDAFGVTQAEIEALDPDGSYARAREDAKRYMAQLEAILIARLQRFAAQLGVEYKVEKLR